MNSQSYLQRINFSSSDNAHLEPTSANLRALQRAHLYAVPFENLNITLKRPIVLDLDALHEKIVEHRRGGFCYELNGLFARLLESFGYRVTLLSARVARGDGTFGPEYDHLTLLVYCPADAHPETPWLVDVGFGDSFLEPLRLDTPVEQPQGLRSYRIEPDGSNLDLWQKNYDGTWEKQYRFTLQPRAYPEFQDMCVYHQTSPDSGFTRRRLITQATPNGRVTLEDTRLILTTDSKRTERVLADPAEFDTLLREHFGVAL